ncbi:hypothetical protein [Paenibacillus fonticola]|uniref:hypothetical protein n=1 Tax=Paenibacillus fonticola TaxID=379896 RepID=UPI0012FA14D9|nr:hypothetical protein [Paenibacillus fonticola]
MVDFIFTEQQKRWQLCHPYVINFAFHSVQNGNRKSLQKYMVFVFNGIGEGQTKRHESGKVPNSCPTSRLNQTYFSHTFTL